MDTLFGFARLRLKLQSCCLPSEFPVCLNLVGHLPGQWEQLDRVYKWEQAFIVLPYLGGPKNYKPPLEAGLGGCLKGPVEVACWCVGVQDQQQPGCCFLSASLGCDSEQSSEVTLKLRQ